MISSAPRAASALMVTLLCLTALSTSAFQASTPGLWARSAASSFTTGSSSLSNPALNPKVFSTKAVRGSTARLLSPSGPHMLAGAEATPDISNLVDAGINVAIAFALARLAAVGFDKLSAIGRKAPKMPQEQWDELVSSGKLSGQAYRVLHDAGTERPFSSPLLTEERLGIYSCAACGTELFEGETKFDSGTGWPSFYDKLPGVELEEDNQVDKVVNMRSEVHCLNCGGHLGHMFGDGKLWSVPTGKRYCINGVALSFKEGDLPATSPTAQEAQDTKASSISQ